jgi:HPt (histidine-containing phosphotransfer) domain-containing protein
MQTPRLQPLAADRNSLPVPAESGASQVRAATVLDAAALAGLRELDPQGVNRLLERVIRAFQNSLDRLMPQLLEAQSKQDVAGMRHVAHTLKSSSASIGALRLSMLCSQLETTVRSDAVDGLDAQIDALRTEVDAVRPALEQLLSDA